MSMLSQEQSEAPPSSSTLAFVLRLVFSVGSDLALAGVFLITWIEPYTFGERTVHHLTFLMLLEFLVVHATGFLGAVGAKDESRMHRALMTAGLLAFYLCFAGAFSAMYGGWWPLIAFLMLFLGKLPNVVFHPPGFDGQSIVMSNWAAMTCLYLFGAAATVIYDVPPLGVTPEVIAAQQFGVGGEWPEQPFRVMAFGTIYFTGMALVSLATELHTRPRRKPDEAPTKPEEAPPSDWLPKPPRTR